MRFRSSPHTAIVLMVNFVGFFPSLLQGLDPEEVGTGHVSNERRRFAHRKSMASFELYFAKTKTTLEVL